jgi:hypothetical protein
MNPIMNTLRYTLPCVAILLLLMAFGCGKETPPPPNPFDAITDTLIDMPDLPPDSNRITGIHSFIFSQKCAVPGCHDGNFEPDFRTVQSSWSTLVYHPLVKSDSTGYFKFRVEPFQPDKSWLHERITTNDPVLGRMPLYDNPLSPALIKNIRNWINAGAPDMFGNVSGLPNTQPQFKGLAAFLDLPVFGEYRVDTIRSEPYYPFGVLANQSLTIWLDISDDSTAISALSNGKMHFSSDFDDFPGMLIRNAVFSAAPKFVPDFYGPGMPGEFYWKVEVNTGQFPVGEVTFMRFYVEDGSHPNPFEFPKDEHPLEYKTYMSFYVAQ